MGSSLRNCLIRSLCCATQASEPTIMLSPAEEAALIQAQERAHEVANGKTKSSESLRLEGIIYSHEKSWTIWINGRSIKPGHKLATLRILTVTPESVEMIWSPRPGERYQVFLGPNEVFQPPNADR